MYPFVTRRPHDFCYFLFEVRACVKSGHEELVGPTLENPLATPLLGTYVGVAVGC